MYEELSEECQRGDSATKKQVHKRHKSTKQKTCIERALSKLGTICAFCAFCVLLKSCVRLEFFEALDSNPATA